MRGPEKHGDYPTHVHPKGGPYESTHIQSLAGGAVAAALIPRSCDAASNPDATESDVVGAAAWDLASGLDPFFITDALAWYYDF